MKTSLGRSIRVLVAFVVGIVVAAMLAGPSSAAPQGYTAGPGCAWPMRTHAGALNLGFPETNATYWVQPYRLGVGDWIDVQGTYPAARYFSINSYGLNFTAANWLHDSQIHPDAGSHNPYSGQGSGPGRSWHMRVVRDDVRANPARNEIAGPEIGLLIERVYVPDNPASDNGGVPLPTVTMHVAGGSTTLTPCADSFASTGALGALVTGGVTIPLIGAANAAFPASLPEATFINPLSTDGLLANGEGRYLGAITTYRPGRVVVIRGKAPTFPNTRAGASTTTPTQLRYWSVCTNDRVPPYPVTSCAADYRTRVDSDGYYTYVVAAPGDLAGVHDPSLTVIPWGSTAVPQKVLVYRQFLPSGAFYPVSVMASQDRHTAPAATMGAYYPRARYCDTAVLRAGGWRACFR